MTSPAPGGRLRHHGLLATTFFSGLVVMGLELVAFRLYAPHFGYSTYVWGSMIGVVMIGLAAGYALGGRLADRARDARPLYLVITASGLAQATVLLYADSLLGVLADVDPRLGPLAATFAIFALPVTALAITGPYVVRMLGREGHIGRTAGSVSALSTVGSIVGVFGTSFFLVPTLGTRATLIGLCAGTLALGASGLALERAHRLAVAALVPLLLLPLSRPLGWMEGAVFVSESAYNLVRVVEREDERLLILNHANAAQTTMSTDGWTGRYYDVFAVGPLLTPGRRLLVLGMGAGGSITTTRHAAPDVVIDAVELDPEVVRAAERFFGLRRVPALTVHVADARPWLSRQRGTWDLVHLDVFAGGYYAPFHLVTREAFHAIRARLDDDGVLMMNVYDGSEDQELLASIGRSMADAFPSVFVVPRGRKNRVVLAFPRAVELAQVRARLARGHDDPRVDGVARKAASELRPLPAGGVPFTDDHAPVESVTRRMLLEIRQARER